MKILGLLFLSVAVTSTLTSGVILSSIPILAADTDSDEQEGRETAGGSSRPLCAMSTSCPAPSSSGDTALSTGISTEMGAASTFVGHRPMPFSDLSQSQTAPGRDERPLVYDHGSGREGSSRFGSERVASFRGDDLTSGLMPSHAAHEHAPRRGAPLDISASTTGFSDRSTRPIVIPPPPPSVATFFSGSEEGRFDPSAASVRPSPTRGHGGGFGDFDDGSGGVDLGSGCGGGSSRSHVHHRTPSQSFGAGDGGLGGTPWGGSTRSFGAHPPSPTFGRDSAAAAAGFSASGGAGLGSAHGGGSSRSPVQQYAPLLSPDLGTSPGLLAFVHHAATSGGFHPGTSGSRGVGGHGFSDGRGGGGAPIGLLSTLLQSAHQGIGDSGGGAGRFIAAASAASRLLRASEMSEVTRTMPAGVVQISGEGVWEYCDRDGALWTSSTPPSREDVTRITVGRRLQFDIPCRQPERMFEWLRNQCTTIPGNPLARYTIGARGVRLVRDIVATHSVEELLSGRRREVAERLGYVLPVLLCHAQFAQFDYALPTLLQRGFLVEGSRRMDVGRDIMYQVAENTNVWFAVKNSIFCGYDGTTEDGFISAEGAQWLYDTLVVDRRFRQ